MWALEYRDGFALAAELGDGAVDHVIGDPPYDEKTHEGARSLKSQRKVGIGNGGNDQGIDFAVVPPPSAFVPAFVRCAKRWVISFCALEQLGAYSEAAGEAWVRAGLWVRTNGTPQITGDRPAQGGEGLAIMHRAGKKHWNRHGDRGVWTGVRDDCPRRIHPTKKPLWLMEKLIRGFTDPNDLVFDPASGEGTTGEACVRLGRRFIGCEIDPKYHTAGVARIDRAARGLKQTELFA